MSAGRYRQGEIMVKVIEVSGDFIIWTVIGLWHYSEATYDTAPLVPLKTESSQAYQSEE